MSDLTHSFLHESLPQGTYLLRSKGQVLPKEMSSPGSPELAGEGLCVSRLPGPQAGFTLRLYTWSSHPPIVTNTESLD